MGRLVLTLNSKELVRARIDSYNVEIYHLISRGGISLVGIVGAIPSLSLGPFDNENFKIGLVNFEKPLYLELPNQFNFKIYRNDKIIRKNSSSFMIQLAEQYGITRHPVENLRRTMWDYVDDNLSHVCRLIKKTKQKQTSLTQNLYK